MRGMVSSRVGLDPDERTEKQLRELRIKQRSTIEDIKKKTNYYTTKNLLEKYDEGPGKVCALRPSSLSSLFRSEPHLILSSGLVFRHPGTPGSAAGSIFASTTGFPRSS